MPEITPIINGGAISRWVESTPPEETLLALNENGQVVASNAVMQSALPCPTRIKSGRVYKTVEDQQIGFRLPIVIEAGASLVMAPGSTLYQN